MMSILRRITPSENGNSLTQNMPSLFLLAAVLYNAFLAIINGYVAPIGMMHVVAAEMLIVAAAVVFVASQARFFRDISLPFAFLFFAFLMFLYLSVMQDYFYIKAFRDILLIVLFFMLGGLITETKLVSVFRFISIIILVFIVIEITATDFYVSIFHPSVYYANTRGIEEFSLDSSGLYRNSLGFEGRFSFGLLSSHRVSSIFLEQVSMANFLMVLAVFLCAFWKRLKKADRFLFALTILTALVSNSSRTATVLVVILLAGYFVFPYLPRLTTLIYMPMILISAIVTFYDPNYQVRYMEDNLSGRMGRTINFITNMDSEFFVGGNLTQINDTSDSGYAYIIFSQTLLGLLALWLFTSFAVPQNKPDEKRFAHGLNLCIFLNLLIGSAIFSIKVSAPLWLIAGFFYYKYHQSPEGALRNDAGR